MRTFPHSWSRADEGKPWGETLASETPKYWWECEKCGERVSWPIDDGEPAKVGCPVPDGADYRTLEMGRVDCMIEELIGKLDGDGYGTMGERRVRAFLYRIAFASYDAAEWNFGKAESGKVDAPLDIDGVPVRLGDWLEFAGFPDGGEQHGDAATQFKCCGWFDGDVEMFPDLGQGGGHAAVLAGWSGTWPLDGGSTWYPAAMCRHIEHDDAGSLLRGYDKRRAEYAADRGRGLISQVEFERLCAELLAEYTSRIEELVDCGRQPGSGMPR